MSLGIPTIGYDHGGVGEQLSAVLPEGRVLAGNIDGLEQRTMTWLEAQLVVPIEQPFTL